MSKSLEIEFLKEKIKMMENSHKTEKQLQRKDWRQLYNNFVNLQRIMIKENLIGTKYFCSCSDCEINVFYKTTFTHDDDYGTIDKKAFCECCDADILPMEIFHKWFPNEEQEPPVYNNE